MSYNMQQGRIGKLFQTPFKRALVENESYYKRVIYYIHSNPQHHGLIEDFRDWQWSSYSKFLMDKPSNLNKEEVVKWFEDVKGFKQFHSEKQEGILDSNVILDD